MTKERKNRSGRRKGGEQEVKGAAKGKKEKRGRKEAREEMKGDEGKKKRKKVSLLSVLFNIN